MDNQNKSSLIQWVGPTIVMMIAVIAMLVNFTHKANQEAESTVTKNLIADVESYGNSLLHELEKVERAGTPIAALLAVEGAKDAVRVSQLLRIAADSAGVDEVLYCDPNGQALDLSGQALDLSGTDYFAGLSEADSSYVYMEEGDAVVVMERISSDAAQGYLLLFYPMERFSGMLLKSGYDPGSFLVLVNSDGKVLGLSGSETNSYVKDGNLVTAVEQVDKTAARSLRGRMNNGSRGSVYINQGKKDQEMFIFAPLGTNRWDLVLYVGGDYVDRQVRYLRKSTSNMVVSLLVVIAVFFCVVMTINIINKFRTNAKKKELEDKADTDLLTGLNNKLATERKIKDYMANHPDTQSMLFIFDVDNFKKVNDTMGHAFGDEVLRSLGKQIGGIFRASDIVGRVGGDEFMVFLKDIATEDAILKEAAKVETFFKGFQAGEYVKYKATASIGVAIYPQEGADFETLYKAADQGLYKAKKRGKNQLAFYRERTEEGRAMAELDATLPEPKSEGR
ncbi:MAG: diguanylate cyclase [Bacteroidales bacterium]|nr:diguanylate cyclase [Bacteroidales bacterium]MCM1414933.1 diguanylate cyclase [bacterium]MCM1423081.1 diguanylate cyclase [bacterium]